MTRHVSVLIGAAVTAIALVAGCAERGGSPATPEGPGPQTVTITLSYEELMDQKKIDRSVTLAVGDTLQVSLGSNPSTGYQWAPDMRISNPEVLVQTGHETLAPSATRPGAPGSDVWVFQAIGIGSATVATSYDRPWEGGEKETWTFTAAVTVR